MIKKFTANTKKLWSNVLKSICIKLRREKMLKAL